MACAVTRNYQSAETEAFTALHNLGDTVDVNELVIKVQIGRINPA
jgi:hypothetical protein